MNTQAQKCGYPYCGCVGQCYIKSQSAPTNCTPLDEYIAEMEKDPEIKQLLDIAREDVKKLSTKPSLAPSWQGLTSKEVEEIEMRSYTLQVSINDYEFSTIAFYEGIEQALKEKNDKG